MYVYIGDALIFQSHKYHCIDYLRKGNRYILYMSILICVHISKILQQYLPHRKVFVIEFWQGDERSCAHRCFTRFGVCNYTVNRAKLGSHFLPFLYSSVKI